MRTHILVSLAAAPALLFCTSAFAAESLSAGSCQPLTPANRDQCCADKDWQNLILSGDFRFCPPVPGSDNTVRLGDELTDNAGGGGVTVPGGDTGGVGTDPGTTGSIEGNPGNQKEVGGSGEKGKDNESPKTGDRGDGN